MTATMKDKNFIFIPEIYSVKTFIYDFSICLRDKSLIVYQKLNLILKLDNGSSRFKMDVLGLNIFR